MRAGFNITTENGPMTIVVTLAELVRWGRQTGQPVASIGETSDIGQWLELVFWAGERTGQIRTDFDTFLASIESIEWEGEVAPKATKRAASSTRSPRSK